jgi:hypothetical protein
MEEEWMRDRAFLRDLLRQHPQASPQELARMTGRSVSWVKKWRKRLTEDDPHDPFLLCSRSRAHHAPYFRWDIRVTQRIVEMRFSPPENLKRVPGPRALLYYLPRDPQLQAAQVPLPRSSRTKWRDPACHGLPGDTFQRVAPSQRSARAIGRDPDGFQRCWFCFA